jgi:hypothetical protein
VNLKALVGGTALAGIFTTLAVPSLVGAGWGGELLTTVKWSSLILGFAVGIVFLFKHEVLGNKNIEQGEYGILRRWGKIVVDKETGLPRLRTTGKRHFYVKHASDYLVQNVRARITPDKPTADHLQRGRYHGRVVEYIPVLKWHVEDDVRAVVKSLVALAQVNRADTSDKTLENFVYAQVCGAIAKHLSEFDADDEGQPLITLDPAEATVPKGLMTKLAALREDIGVIVDQVSTPTNAPTPEQVLSEGLQTQNPGKRLPLGAIMGSRQANRRP